VLVGCNATQPSYPTQPVQPTCTPHSVLQPSQIAPGTLFVARPVGLAILLGTSYTLKEVRLIALMKWFGDPCNINTCAPTDQPYIYGPEVWYETYPARGLRFFSTIQ